MITRSCISDALQKIDADIEYILENVSPGTPGKIEAVMKLRNAAERMVFDYAHRSRPIPSVLPYDHADA